MGIYWTAVLICHLLPSLVHLLSCDEGKQYKWPTSSPTWCCQKCEPGEFMEKRCRDGTIGTKCQKCSQYMYTDVPNFLAQCKMCKSCLKSANQVQKAACSRQQNAVCDCKQGYKCTDAECSECVKEDQDPGQVNTTQQPTTTERRKTTVNKERHESVLLPLVLIVCVCILLLILVHMRKRLDPLDLSSSKDTPQSTELEEAVPIQEVCSDLQEVKHGLEGEFSLEHNHIY